MTSRIDFDRLFDRFDALTVGFGPAFREFSSQTPAYPPHNIVRVSDNEFYLELAVAGFKKDEVTMEVHQGVLTVKGDKATDTAAEYQFRGIANRSFSKSFRIAEFFEVADARLEDGILNVRFVKNQPDETKPKLIAIN